MGRGRNKQKCKAKISIGDATDQLRIDKSGALEVIEF